MDNTESKPVTAKLGTVDLLKATDLENIFAEVMVNALNVRNLPRGEAAEAFIFSKLDDLTAFIDTQCPGTPTLPEVKVAIQAWIDKQMAEAVLG